MNPYKKVIEYHFVVNGQIMSIIYISEDRSEIVIEEVEKNGQEDTHMSGTLKWNGGEWIWEQENFSEWNDPELSDAIRHFINNNGVPNDN